jgi:aspartate carbamoyltransferase catalytic subunit
LAHGRTVHSLIRLLNRYPGNEFHLISPWLLRLDRTGGDSPLYEEIRGKVAQTYHVKAGLQEAIAAIEQADVVYMTRVQKERFTYAEGYAEVRDSCLLTPELVGYMKPTACIMHPLPRVNEIPAIIDSDPRAAYFRQVRAGLHVRMALLSLVLGV